MKKIILLCFALIASNSLRAQSDPVITEIDCSRITPYSDTQYKFEWGTLGEYGFIPKVFYLATYGSNGRSFAEIASISGQSIFLLSFWVSFEDHAKSSGTANVWRNFSRSQDTYNLDGESYVSIRWVGPTSTTVTAPRLINMSVRAVVPNGGSIIAGFVIKDGPVKVLIRVGGPALASLGVSGTLSNPKMTLFKGSTPIAINDDWSAATTDQTNIASAAQKSGAFPYAAGSKDSAIFTSLAAGSYTVSISGNSGTTGEVLLEVYEVPN
jgi:hypothetical protein